MVIKFCELGCIIYGHLLNILEKYRMIVNCDDRIQGVLISQGCSIQGNGLLLYCIPTYFWIYQILDMVDGFGLYKWTSCVDYDTKCDRLSLWFLWVHTTTSNDHLFISRACYGGMYTQETTITERGYTSKDFDYYKNDSSVLRI